MPKTVSTVNSSKQPEKAEVKKAENHNKEPEKPIIKRIVRKGRKSYTPSIMDALSENTTERKESDSAQSKKEILKDKNKGHDPFTQEQMNAKWEEYIQKLTRKPGLKAALSHPPVLTDNYQLQLNVGSSLLNEELKTIKINLLDYLQKELNNSDITLTTKIIQIKQNRKHLSEEQILKEMYKKNPDMKTFLKKFYLDF